MISEALMINSTLTTLDLSGREEAYTQTSPEVEGEKGIVEQVTEQRGRSRAVDAPEADEPRVEPDGAQRQQGDEYQRPRIIARIVEHVGADAQR